MRQALNDTTAGHENQQEASGNITIACQRFNQTGQKLAANWTLLVRSESRSPGPLTASKCISIAENDLPLILGVRALRERSH